MTFGSRLIAVSVAAAMASSAACSDSEPGQAPPGDAVRVDEATLHELNAEGRDFQGSLATDRLLTRAEYDQLAYTYRQCVLEAGGEFSPGTMETAFGTYHFGVFYPEAAGPAVERCATEYWRPLGALWSLHHQPTRDQIQAANDALGACLRRRGVEFPYEHPTGDQFTALLAAGTSPEMLDCVREVSTGHGMPNFSGG